jgi:hypothetical protein
LNPFQKLTPYAMTSAARTNETQPINANPFDKDHTAKAMDMTRDKKINITCMPLIPIGSSFIGPAEKK